jgi:peptide/nickel transport system permease protein
VSPATTANNGCEQPAFDDWFEFEEGTSVTALASGESVAEVAAGGSEPPASTGTLRFVLTKIGGGIVSLLLVVVLGFFLFRVLPGDPIKTMTRGQPIGTRQLLQLRAQLGLDKPLIVQFFDYLGNLLHGDFGTSYFYNQPVGQLVLAALWPTVLLVGTATVIAIALGLWLGTRGGWRPDSVFDKTSTTIALTLWSVPQFWLGIILVLVFAQGIGPIPGLFPVSGIISADVGPGFLAYLVDLLHHLVLPCLTLVAAVYAQYLLIMRSSLVDEMGADYLVTARAKGLRDDAVRRRHAVPNALLPTVTLIFLNLGLVVNGAVAVEVVYSWPGLGLLMYNALNVPDLPLIQGAFITLAGAVIVMNVLADLVYRLHDPRVRAS